MADRLPEPQGIPSINTEGKVAVGALVSMKLLQKASDIGKASEGFFIKKPYADDSGYKPLHDDFSVFNNAHPAKRRSIRGVLVHASVKDAAFFQVSAYTLPGFKSPPNKAPACRGNEVTAVRYTGKGDNDGWEEIPCPGLNCRFRQEGLCKAMSLVYFMPIWNDPSWRRPLMEFQNRSWYTTRNLRVFFANLFSMARSLGVENPSLLGIPFVMQWYKAKKAKGVFPAANFSIDGDLITHLQVQRQEQNKLLEQYGINPQIAYESPADKAKSSPERLGEICAELTTGYHPKQAMAEADVVDAEVEPVADGANMNVKP